MNVWKCKLIFPTDTLQQKVEIIDLKPFLAGENTLVLIVLATPVYGEPLSPNTLIIFTWHALVGGVTGKLNALPVQRSVKWVDGKDSRESILSQCSWRLNGPVRQNLCSGAAPVFLLSEIINTPMTLTSTHSKKLYYLVWGEVREWHEKKDCGHTQERIIWESKN